MQAVADFLGRFAALGAVASDARFQALAVVLLSIGVARITDRLISGWILRWARQTETDLDDELVGILHRPIFVFVLLGGIAIAAGLLGLDGALRTITYGGLGSVGILVGLDFAIRLNRLVLETLSHHPSRFRFIDQRTLPLFRNVNNVLLVGGGAYFFFLIWNLDVSAWLASAGIVGIAVGFGARDTVANFFAGVLILADAPYKIGDFIVLDSGERGMVTQIGLRSTRMLTRDDIEVTVPNAIMGNTKIINETGGPYVKERIRVRVSCAYGSDIDQVKEVLLSSAAGHPLVCAEPTPRVRFRTLGVSGVDLELLAWIEEPVLRGRVLDALNTEVYERFAKEGIEIPYEKQDLYVKEFPPDLRARPGQTGRSREEPEGTAP
ncbi:MAG: mechanosensitive ion channel family protein [Gammaproteobacteria bacterium]|nr:mechanosensitive ion channel family protein [Gammaproteobacteria bacterium]